MKMGIKECAKSYAQKAGCSLAEAERAMKTAVEVLKDGLVENGEITFVGLFSLKVVERAERNGVNPATRQPQVIPAYKTVKVSVGKQLKEELNK